MPLTTEINNLLKKELKLELRNRYALNGIILYIVSTCFICYLSFKQIADESTWNSLYWIIILFSAINAITKSFVQESKGRSLYMYSIASPQSIIISKIGYNTLLLLMLAIIGYLFYGLFVGDIVQSHQQFFVTILLGCLGISSILTLTSALASKANNSFGLMAILSFPIIVPLIMVIIHLSKNAIDGLNVSVSYNYMLVLGLLDIIVITLSYMLFPYLYKE